MVTTEELAIIIPIVVTVIIPFVLLGLSRYLKSSEYISRTTIVTTEAINDLEAYVKNHRTETQDMKRKIDQIERVLDKTCWRVDNIEREHNKGKYD